MSDDPLEAVYSYVERAYVRMQAGDLLIRCLEDGSIAPIQQIAEGLILSGTHSLSAMREILAEAQRRRSQVIDDLVQILKGMDSSLTSYGVRLSQLHPEKSLPLEKIATNLSPATLLDQMRVQGIHDNATQVACLQILKESRDLFASLQTRLCVLEDIVAYLEDWLLGMAFQTARHIDFPL